MSEQNKKCDVCESPIPDDFVNLLCYVCYDRQAKEIEDKKKEEEELRQQPQNIVQTQPIDEPSGKAALSLENTQTEEKQAPTMPLNESKTEVATPNTLISDPDYQENPEMPDKNQVKANIDLFMHNGVLLWKPTRLMYEFIKNHCMWKATQHPQYPKFIWKPTVVDVGCGSGVGSNVISQEADFVWGIDKNELSVQFAKEAFTRVKNGVYYNSQVSFDVFDIVNENRETMKFDIVVAIEIIEHIADCYKFLEQITKKFDTKSKDNPTEYFISTPNRNHKTIQKDKPRNIYHVREFTSQEFHAVLSHFFEEVQFFSAAGEPTGIDTTHTPLLAKCRFPKNI